MKKPSRNEIIKLTANTANGLGMVLFSLGVINPALAALLNQADIPVALLAYSSVTFFVTAALLHLSARRILKKLDDDRY